MSMARNNAEHVDAGRLVEADTPQDAACTSSCCGGVSATRSGQPNDECSPPEAIREEACFPDNASTKSEGKAKDFISHRNRRECDLTCCSSGNEKSGSSSDGQPANTNSVAASGIVCCAEKTVHEHLNKTDGGSGCCSSLIGAKLKTEDEGVNPNEPTPAQNCQNTCCDNQKRASIKADVCNGSSDSSGKDRCCSSSPRNTPVPSCCEGKQSRCCDDSCVERLVLRETSALPEQDTLSAKGASIRERYATRLAALGCLCRALVALGQESCCSTRELSSVERKRSKKCSPLSDRSHGVSSTSEAPSQAAECGLKTRQRPSIGCGCRSTSEDGDSRSLVCSKGCCGRSQETPKSDLVKPTGPECGDACCAERPAPDLEITRIPLGAPDLEKGYSSIEHVVLSISGMTCTGCETKLQATLGKVPTISHIKSSLVMARVEFDLRGSSASSIMKHIERTTEFKCDRITTGGSLIEIIADQGAQIFTQKAFPNGVKEAIAIDEKTVRIVFDPNVIGARDLVERGYDIPLVLVPQPTDLSLASGNRHVRHIGLMTLLSAVLTIPVLALAWAPLEQRPIAYGSVSLALATIVQFAVAGPFYPTAIKSLVFSGVIEMDLLIVLSTSVAYIFSVVSFGFLVRGQPLSTGEFFETSTLLVTLIMVGRWISALSRQKAVESISIKSLQTSTALLVSPQGVETEIDTRLLQYGDTFKVVPDTQVPTDGVVISGTSEIDESMLTGESRPIEKGPGSTVIAGSLNGSGLITVRLMKIPCENTINTIADMVDAAKLSKPKIQDMADRVASYFVPVIIALTLIVFIVWVAVDMCNQGKSGSESVIRAITYAITVLIVSCPCAIGLAVPMVIVMASGVAANHGLIFKTAESIEIAHRAEHVIFDKTGTLTEGKMSVVVEEYCSQDSQNIAPMILGLLNNIKHPVSIAVATYIREQGASPSEVADIKVHSGKGVEGYVGDLRIQAGNCRWLASADNPLVQAVLSKGCTAFCVTVDSELQAVFGLKDTRRPDSAAVITELKKRNVSVSILSGDDDGAVQAVATSLGIPPENARSRCSPADKQAYIQELLDQGRDERKKSPPVVVFVGDGTNDAVALAQATIGVHVNAGTDVAQSAADVVLMRPSLGGVVTMVDVSRAAVRRILFNFGWSFVYNVLAILLAAGAFTSASRSARIPPEFAGLGELVSVLPVVLVALSLRWARV
ncbi:heavy metal translocatin [Xylariaceae sp. FL0016]|nr:heavy metal translocatin [Xylariaceae sp. FL0016]